jgi:transposase
MLWRSRPVCWWTGGRDAAKTDRIDANTLIRTLKAHTHGDAGVWRLVQIPTPEQEEARWLHRDASAGAWSALLRDALGPDLPHVSYAIACGLAPLAAVTIYSAERLAGLAGRLVSGVAGARCQAHADLRLLINAVGRTPRDGPIHAVHLAEQPGGPRESAIGCMAQRL